jgi:hypothetical protein
LDWAALILVELGGLVLIKLSWFHVWVASNWTGSINDRNKPVYVFKIYFSKIHFNIILPSTLNSSKGKGKVVPVL